MSYTEGQTEHATTVSAGSILTLGPGVNEEQACGSLQDLAHRLRLSVVRFRTSVPSRSDTTAGTRRLLNPNVCSWIYLVLFLALPSSG